ncbi:hypothetical protein FHS61_001481 [Altererythrobacter atlanticus]|nr:hypothetical protein [Croceibacterium atlanticum]MBB5732472.1 hypothetical protein [Croceibacterium atlanticum]
MVEFASAENGAKPDFSGLLASLVKPLQGKDGMLKSLSPEDALPGEEGGSLPSAEPADGSTLPLMVKTGKILPLSLPAALPVALPVTLPIAAGGEAKEITISENGESADKTEDGQEIADAAMLVGAAPLLAVTAQEAPITPSATDKPDMMQGAQSNAAMLAQKQNDPKQADPKPADPKQAGRAEMDQAPAVSLRMADRSANADLADSSAGTGRQDMQQGGQRPEIVRQAQTVHAQGVIETVQTGSDAFTQATAAPAIPAAPQPAAHGGTNIPSLNPAANMDARQDLMQIVNRLVAAREAAAPATADFSIDHAEFGELSLRIDQRQDGRLAVELSARDPDAHRAIAAAMAADRGQFSGNDQSGTNSQQHQNAQTRGGTAEREAGAGNGSNNSTARQDQPHGRADMRDSDQNQPGGEPRSGIFA